MFIVRVPELLALTVREGSVAGNNHYEPVGGLDLDLTIISVI